MNYPEKLYLDDITGLLGHWFEWDTSDIPKDVLDKLGEAYELAEQAIRKGVK